jgi:hypothetical protein
MASSMPSLWIAEMNEETGLEDEKEEKERNSLA